MKQTNNKQTNNDNNNSNDGNNCSNDDDDSYYSYDVSNYDNDDDNYEDDDSSNDDTHPYGGGYPGSSSSVTVAWTKGAREPSQVPLPWYSWRGRWAGTEHTTPKSPTASDSALDSTVPVLDRMMQLASHKKAHEKRVSE